MFEENEREILRKVALDSAARAMGLRSPAPPVFAADSALSHPSAVFVTWRRDGRPRGRSGTTEALRSLAVEVEAHAVAALLRDPRVPPPTVRELPRYIPEIAVLSTFEEISGPLGLVAGQHGVLVEKGKRRGVVLPQDGAGYDWDGARLLTQACLRAGLPEEGWKAANRPRLLRFTAEVF
jgi:uncharacterized protein